MGQTALLWYLWTENAFFQYRFVLMNAVSTCPSSSLNELCIWIYQVSALAVEFACPVLKGKLCCSRQHSNCHMSPGFIVTDNEIWIFFLEKHVNRCASFSSRHHCSRKAHPVRKLFCLGLSVSESGACGTWSACSPMVCRLLIHALLSLVFAWLSVSQSPNEGIPGEIVTGSLFWVIAFI